MNYLITFLEGFISFISPCMLPMLPLYISYFAGGNKNVSESVLLFSRIYGSVLLAGRFCRNSRNAVDEIQNRSQHRLRNNNHSFRAFIPRNTEAPVFEGYERRQKSRHSPVRFCFRRYLFRQPDAVRWRVPRLCADDGFNFRHRFQRLDASACLFAWFGHTVFGERSYT